MAKSTETIQGITMARNWNRREVALTVKAYLDMLEAELAGRPINKAAVRRALLPKLDNRSNGSLEFKNCNISAAMISMGLPPIDGYKPRWNYQHDLLHAVIGESLRSRQGLFETVEEAVERRAERPDVSDILSIFDPAIPERGEIYGSLRETIEMPDVVPRDYLEQETRNRSIGLAGEKLVLEFERSRLISLNREKLADRIEHVSIGRGDGEGFDVRSFDEHGKDLFIEVKTTQFRKEAPFFISANEVRFSERNSDHYSLYRVYAFTKNPKLFMLPGNVTKRCHLSPTAFRASF
ncbi:MAG: DUF3883 domain-containing protein [Verrucomicrobiae bacterium]|nr:DUF3883 domain-containing protein [Verrucomicrobiae bacterium]